MRHSLRTRLICIFSGMIFFVILICWCMNLFLLPWYYQKTKIVQMNKVYSTLEKSCKDINWDSVTADTDTEFSDLIDGISANSGVNIYLMKIYQNPFNGSLSADYKYPSMSDRQKDISQTQLQEYLGARLSGQKLNSNYKLLMRKELYDVYKVYDERIGSNYIELIGGFGNSSEDGVWIYMRSNYQSMQESANASNELLLYVGLFAITFGIAVMVFVSNSYTKPILRLAIHAKRMTELNFNVRYDENRIDEIGVLGRSMNALSDKLEETISELKTANNELKLDIERKQEQEEMRTEFLANVSHELKTPIALIQGYAEGLQDNINDDQESREFYCEVIIDEAVKMNKMVKKLLSLNQLEFGNGQVHFERFDIAEVVQTVVSSIDILGKQKEAEVSFIRPNPIYIWADEYMIEEVVTNYVSNALNHVDGENRIEIKIEQGEKTIRVSVFNTGKPIPEEDIDKIWDKFYKVDKARTRAYGGNGIGLSIVKAIMEVHNQSYGVINYENGVEFWFEADIDNEVKKSIDE